MTADRKECIMLSLRSGFCLALAGILICAALLPADDPLPDEKQVEDAKAGKRTPAASVQFRKELGLPYSTLNTLGARIDAARRTNDPVALANAASELNVAEGVSEKKAALTSNTLIKEAAELAKLRKENAELRAVLRINDQIAGAGETQNMLKKEIADAQERARAYQMYQEPTYTPRKLIVNNYTTQYIDINVNGRLRMQILPGQSQSCLIEHRWNPVVITAYGDADDAVWGPRKLWGRFKEYTWNLN
jgi:hypothetical protein